MDINMALETVGELLEHYFTMRLTMAFLTLRNIFVLVMMAFYARNLTMFACRCLYFVIGLSMTAAANFIPYSITISDLER